MGDTMNITAADISTAILDVTGEALMTGNFDAFLSVFHVPQHMETLGGPIFMETEEDMRRAFDQMHNHLRAVKITDLVRKVVASEYGSGTRIESTHTSEALQNGKRMSDPYPVFSVIEKIDGTWKVTRSEYALAPTSGQALALAHADAKQRR